VRANTPTAVQCDSPVLLDSLASSPMKGSCPLVGSDLLVAVRSALLKSERLLHADQPGWCEN